MFGSEVFGKQRGSCRSHRSTSTVIDIFLSGVMAKNLKRKRGQVAALEEDEVRVGLVSITELTIAFAQVRDPRDLTSVDGHGPEDAGSETEPGSSNSEEEEWGGIGGVGEVDPLSSSGKPVKVPAGHELREMKEASELYKSSVFKLQVRKRCNLFAVWLA